MRIFFDTSAFAALENRRDGNHRSATREYRRLIREQARLLTSDYVFDETVTLLKVRAGSEVAVGWGRRMLATSLFELLDVDRSVLAEALDIVEGAADQPFSFTDCTSFALMRRLGVEVAFAFDDDFRRFGFNHLPSERKR